MAFTVKSVKPKTNLGRELAALREASGWTIEKASRETQIQPAYLKAIEANRWQDIPDEPVRSYIIKRYIRVLGNDPSLRTLASFILNQNKPVKNEIKNKEKIKFTFSPYHLKYAGLAVIFAGLTGFLGLQVYALVSPPQLTIESPKDGLPSFVPTVTVSGKTEQAAAVSINDEPVLKAPDGTFSYPVNLEQGVNIIAVKAAKRYSKSRIIYRSVLFQNSPPVSIQNNPISNQNNF